MRKLSVFFITIITLFILVACGEENSKLSVKDVLDEISIEFSNGENSQNVKSDFMLQEEALGFEITWTSLSLDVLVVNDFKASVNRPDKGDVNAKLRAVISFENVNHQKTFDFTVSENFKHEVKFFLDQELTTVYKNLSVGNGKTLASIDKPAKDGYDFVGWFDSETNELFDINQTILENLTLYAKWELIVYQDGTFTENFESLGFVKNNGGNFSSYETFEYDGVGGEWEITNARIDLGLKLGGNALTLKGTQNDFGQAGLGRIQSPKLEGGLSYLEFEARLPFSPNSTYPQRNGNDKAANVVITVMINGEVVQKLKFDDDKQADKGKVFILEDLNVVGDFNFNIDVSSGHRLTVDNIVFKSNLNGVVEDESIVVDFETDKFDFDQDPMIRTFGKIDFEIKEVHTNIMHGAKEMPFMNQNGINNGTTVARFRGASAHFMSTPTAYMQTVDSLNKVNSISLDARLFGELTYYTYDSTINIYYMEADSSEWVLSHSKIPTEDFKTYNFNIDKENVRLKIEVVNGSINIDNLTIK